MLIAVLLATGLAGEERALAERETADAGINLDFVPDDAQFVAILRPAELCAVKELQVLRTAVENTGVLAPLTLPLEQLAEIKFSLAGKVYDRETAYSVFMLRSKEPYDWTQCAVRFLGKTEALVVDGQAVFQERYKTPQVGMSYWLPDDRTIVIANTMAVARTFTMRGEGVGPAWHARLDAAKSSPAVVMVQRPLFEQWLALVENPSARPVPIDGNQDDVWLLTAKPAARGFELEGTLECSDPLIATAAANRLQTGVLAARNRVSATRIPPRDVLSLLLPLVAKVTEHAEFELFQSIVKTRVRIQPESQQNIARALLETNEAARRYYATQQMKQLSNALMTYRDKYRRYPNPIEMGADGKTPHSWRVAILPFLDAEAREIHRQYRQGEPWDSPHNKQLIAAGAKYFTPLKHRQQSCGFFAVTGSGSFLEADVQPQVGPKPDGARRTVWLVDAVRDTPWTKPEDVACEADQPLPEMGRNFEGVLQAGFADGVVRFLPKTINETTIRALISRAGGEPIDFDPDTDLPLELEE